MQLKDIVKYLYYYLGMSKALFWFMRKGRSKLFVFTYHRVSASSDKYEYLTVPQSVFEEQIKFIKDNFKTVSALEGLNMLDRGDSNEIYAAINFDDGYMDNYLYAYHILEKYDMPATIFLTTDFIGKECVFWWDRVFNIISSSNSNGVEKRKKLADEMNSFLMKKSETEREYLIEELKRDRAVTGVPAPHKMLGWDEIKRMRGPLVSFGAHTKTHRNLCLLQDDEVRSELIESKKIIEKRLGTEVTEFSYPFGSFDDRIKRLVCEAGFKYARTSSGGFSCNDTDRFLLPWVSITPFLKASFLPARISSYILAGYKRRAR